jgi:hypothetical protein
MRRILHGRFGVQLWIDTVAHVDLESAYNARAR